jgi:hypothetical protein
MAVTPEQEKASKANFKLFLDALQDPTFPVTQNNYSALLDWLRSQGSIDAVYQPGGQHVFSAAFVACRAANKLTFREPPPDPDRYVPVNPWHNGNKESPLGLHNHAHDAPQMTKEEEHNEAVKFAKTLVNRIVKRAEGEGKPKTEAKQPFREFPVNSSRAELLAAKATDAELKNLMVRQQAAANAARAKE